MKILVTGGAGFIGSNLAQKLVENGNDVIIIDDLSTGYRSSLSGVDARFCHRSILDLDFLIEVSSDVDCIIHLAAIPSVPRSIKFPLASHEANVTGTLHVLEAARNSGAHVVLASSSSVYGSNPKLPKSEEMTPSPISPYAVSKLAAEHYALSWQKSYGLEVLPFRFFNVFGPNQRAGHAYAAVIPAFLSNIKSKNPLIVFGDGSQSRDFTFVDDVTEILMRAAVKRVSSESAVNLAFGSRVTLNELCGSLEQIHGQPLEIKFEAPRVGDVPHSQADTSLLQTMFGELTKTDFNKALLATHEWFMSAESE